MRAFHWLPLCAATLLAACAPAPRVVPDDARIDTPTAWTTPAAVAIGERWWQGFGNVGLSRHIDAALTRNANAQIAATRVAAARAQLALAEASLLPALSAGMAAGATHTLTSPGIATTRSAQPQLQAAWEADLWGKLGDRQSAAAWQLQASQAERDGVRLSIAAATAQAYIDLLARQAQLAQTRKTAELRQKALMLAQDQQLGGYISRLQLGQAEAEYEAVRQQIPALQLALSRQRNALQLLAGELPAAQAEDAAQARAFDALALPPVPGVLPSELLERRPDLTAAAAQLAAADANLSASRAAYLPSVQLSASLGGLYVNTLDYDPIKVWSLGGSVLAPLFDGGRLDAQYDAATAQRDQAAYAYRSAVLTAFGEVENAFAGTLRLQEQLDGARRRRAVLARTASYAQDRYQAGYSPYIEQLDAERNLYQTEIDVINLRQSQFQNLIALYKALGGGWQNANLQKQKTPLPIR